MQLTDVSSTLAQWVALMPYSSGVPSRVCSCFAPRIAFTTTMMKQFLNMIKSKWPMWYKKRPFTIRSHYNKAKSSNSAFVRTGKLKLTRFICNDLRRQCCSKIATTIYHLKTFPRFLFHSAHNQHQAVKSCRGLSIPPVLQQESCFVEASCAN